MFITFIRRISPLLILLIFAGLSMVLASAKKEPEKKEEQIVLPVVEARAAQYETLTLSLDSYGMVEPKQKTLLVSEVNGRILRIDQAFISGGFVEQGQLLAQIEDTYYKADLAQAEANLAQAQAALEEEVARGEVAKMEFRDFQQKNGGLTPELGLRKPQLAKEQANVKFALAAVDRAKLNLERTEIRAPFAGIIKAREVDLGQYLSVGTRLGELYNTEVAQIRLPLADEKLAYLAQSNTAPNVILTASHAGQQQQWFGKIVRDEGVVDSNSRMLYLVAEVQTPYALNIPLKFGTFVNASIEGRQFEQLVKLPRYLVRNNQVALIDKDNRIEMRNVNVVQTDKEFAYIQGGIEMGERISYTATKSFNEGQQVNVRQDKNSSKQGLMAETVASETQG